MARVSFPHVERAVIVVRPALVIARHDAGSAGALLWTLMITNALRPSLPGDIVIPDAEARGLLIPSKVRPPKMATVMETAATAIGRLDEDTWQKVMAAVDAALDRS